MPRIQWSYVIGSYLSLLGVGLLEVSRGPAYAELLRHFEIDESVGFLFFFGASLAGMLTNVLSGHWMPKLGLRWATRVALIIQVLAFAGMGWVWQQKGSFWVFLIFATGFGVGLGAIGSLCNLLIYEGVPPVRTRRYFSGLHAWYGVAALLAPLLSLLLQKLGWTWPQIFFLLAVIPLPIIVQTWFWPKGRVTLRGEYELRTVLHDVVAWLLALACALYVASEVLVGSRLVVYGQFARSLTETQSSLLLSLFFATLLMGRVFFTLVPLRISNLVLLFSSATLSLVFLSLGVVKSPFWLGAAGLPMSVFFPAVVSLIGEWFPLREGAMMPFMMTMIGAIVVASHWLVGYLSSVWGLQGAFFLVPIFLLLSLLTLGVAAQTRGRRAPQVTSPSG